MSGRVMVGRIFGAGVMVALVVSCTGCLDPDVVPAESTSDGKIIVSDGAITVENGVITEGRPQLTEEKEREIYKALNFRRKMAASANANGRAQMEQEYNLLRAGYCSRYGINEAEIDAIMSKGDTSGWE